MKLNLLIVASCALILAGCDDDGSNGINGINGADGADGLAGINCWDLNEDRIDDPNEDINLDGLWDVQDCALVSSAVAAAASGQQSPEAVLNHQYFCEAFAALGQYPVGCPSANSPAPSGTLTFIGRNQFFDDSNQGATSCNFSPNNGLLSIEYRSDASAWFVLEGGYIAFNDILSINDVILDRKCAQACEIDAKCIASVASRKSNTEAYQCKRFYYSDTIAKYEQICGADAPGFPAADLCKLSLGGDQIWNSRCP